MENGKKVRAFKVDDKDNLRALLANKALRPCVLFFAYPSDEQVQNWIDGNGRHPSAMDQIVVTELCEAIADRLGFNQGFTSVGMVTKVVKDGVQQIKEILFNEAKFREKTANQAPMPEVTDMVKIAEIAEGLSLDDTF